MDFTLDETQEAVARLAAEVLEEARAPGSRPAGPGDRFGAAARAPSRQDSAQWDQARWKELGRAGLLSLALPDRLGGDGLGVLETALVLTEVGRRAAALPALATLALGVLPVTRWGSYAQQQTLLDGVGSGGTVLTAAVREPTAVMPSAPATTARLSGGSGTVTGVKVGVPYAADADWILVPASIASGDSDIPGGPGRVGVVIVARSGAGVSLVRTHSAGAEPEYTLRLDQTPVADLLGVIPEDAAADDNDRGRRVVSDLYRLALAGACCLGDGALAGALALTTAYVDGREQFGRSLATFQAVAGQIADVYVTSRTLHLATLSACWRLASGREAGRDLDVAAYWLADQATAALRTCHHLHGGIGMDVSYPLHRYSSLLKDLARFVGGADHRLDLVAGGGDG